MFDWFRRLVPRSADFFVLFERHSAATVEAGEALAQLVRGEGDRMTLVHAIRDREHEADDVIREVLHEVRQTFLTPFEMGTGLTKLNHHSGFCASTAGSIVVFGASAMGIPVSTTHAIAGSVVGTGAARRTSAVRWTVATRVVTAWFITIPASAGVGAAFYLLTRLF